MPAYVLYSLLVISAIGYAAFVVPAVAIRTRGVPLFLILSGLTFLFVVFFCITRPQPDDPPKSRPCLITRVLLTQALFVGSRLVLPAAD
jgi:hypothetical protein